MDADSFHRVAKVLADSGEAESIEAAQATLSGFGVRVVLHEAVKHDMGLQVIAQTVINAAARTFLGNVCIDAPEDFALLAAGFAGRSLGQFCAWVGVVPAVPQEAWPEIHIGSEGGGAARGTIRAWADGWSFGLGSHHRGAGYFAPACVAAGGLAVSEAFSLLRRDNPYAGRRDVALSLWTPASEHADRGPQHDVSVPGTWLVGLGHLGQAYAWTLGFMRPISGSTVVLQDVDTVTLSTLSTSVLSSAADVGRNKTRVVARWLEARGYTTAIVERRFNEHQRVAATEPRTALFGVDNAAARRVVEGAGFDAVIDAGLGSGFKDFRAMRLRAFPGPSSAAQLWAASDEGASGSVSAPAYQALLAQGAELCGVTTLATRAVGAPFVGCVAAGYVVAEFLRRQIGGEGCAVVDLNLRNPAAMQIVRA